MGASYKLKKTDIRVAKLPRRFYTNKKVIRSMGEGLRNGGVELLILWLPASGGNETYITPQIGNSTQTLQGIWGNLLPKSEHNKCPLQTW